MRKKVVDKVFQLKIRRRRCCSYQEKREGGWLWIKGNRGVVNLKFSSNLMINPRVSGVRYLTTIVTIHLSMTDKRMPCRNGCANNHR